MEANTMPVIAVNSILFWQVLNFLVLVWIFKKFFATPLGAIIEKRKKQIVKDVETAKKDKEETAVMKVTAEKELKEAKIKAQEIVLESMKKAEEMKDDILKETHAIREKMLKAAEADALKMKESAKKDLRNEMTEIAIKLAEKMVREKLDKNVGARLLDEFIEEVGEAQ